MKRLNVARMRKYAAKNTEDYLEVEIDRSNVLSHESSIDKVFAPLMESWRNSMRIKHGEDVHIEVHAYYDAQRMKYTIRAEVVRD